MSKLLRVFSILCAGILLTGSSHGQDHFDCKFIPKNDLNIPDTGFYFNGVNRSEFNRILDGVYNHYRPKFAERGLRFVIERAWNDGNVNAYARREGNTAYIKMFGGLARHRVVTADGFALVACHEVGHHLGGAPKYRGRWASNEGQSDYFATLKCARHIWSRDNNIRIVSRMCIPRSVRSACARQYNSSSDRALCERSAMGGKSLATLLGSLTGSSSRPDFSTPDRSVVRQTDDRHPAGQCRLDTYFQGALCNVSHRTDVSDRNPDRGTCTRARSRRAVGVRPLCWYKPRF